MHKDQHLPPGLHVRLNIWTGHREAKINDPTEVDASLQGLPVDQGIIVVDPDQAEAPIIPKGAPVYDNVGAVKGPPHEAQNFHGALAMLKSGVISDHLAFDSALEDLKDLSHDIYYGVKITEDVEVVKALLCLVADQSIGASTVDGFSPNSQAASILAGALSNNPTALKEVAKNWSEFMSSQCPEKTSTLGEAFYSSIVPPADIDSALAAKTVKAKVGAINGLIKDDIIRAEYLANGGMAQLLEVLAVTDGADKAWAAAQRKIGQLAMDNFLDEEMGAKLGQWPKKPKLDESRCKQDDAQALEGCWDYQVARIMKENSKDKNHWSKELHEKLNGARRTRGVPSQHQEL